VKESQIQHNRKNTPTPGCGKFSNQVKYKWFSHHGLHPLQTQVSIKENTPALGCERLSSHKTNHTSTPVDVVENSGSTIRVQSTATKQNAESGTGHRPSIHSAHRSGQTIKVSIHFQHK
jgi:hypothetical protein